MDAKELGNQGEKMACGYLVEKGYKILGKNYKTTIGEIDIIAKKRGFFADKTIHFIEVKTSIRSGNFFPEERVNFKKQEKYKKLSEVWLAHNKFKESIPYQVDIIAIEGKQINFFENVVSG